MALTIDESSVFMPNAENSMGSSEGARLSIALLLVLSPPTGNHQVFPVSPCIAGNSGFLGLKENGEGRCKIGQSLTSHYSQFKTTFIYV